MKVMSLNYLRKKLEIKAGFLNPRSPSVYLNEDSDESMWNFKSNFIQIGVKSILEHEPESLEKLSFLLLAHEVSHTLNTDSEICDRIKFPFPILNILEDARIEHLISSEKGYDFHDLHEFCYRTFYTKEGMFSNPYNIGVLLRWRRWGVETKTEKPAEMTEKEYEEFLKDWEEAINRSISATSTEEVAKIGEELYRKWEKYFGKVPPESALTGVESNKESMGKGKIEEGEDEGKERKPAELGRPPEECTDIERQKILRPIFDWNTEWIERTVAELRRYLKLPSYSEHEWKTTGRRIDPKRAENLLPPMKRRETITYSLEKKKVLVVIDGSGSMTGEPYYWACHTAYALFRLFRTHIVITTSYSRKSIWIRNMDELRYYHPIGSENYRSLRNFPLKYDFVLFLTDAHVDEEDWRYAGKLSRMCKLGAGYVERKKNTEIEHALKKVFSRYFYSKPEHVAVEIGLFLKRLFLRRG